ncbi:MAG: RsmE family RNA methyltransferase [Candidatus Hydrogenedentales bacterium]
MPHLHRFYVPPESLVGDVIALPADEAHHARQVVRVRIGDTVELFDGAGCTIDGVVAAMDRHGVTVAVGERRTVLPPARRVVLVQAALNRERSLEAVLQRATELGVAEVRVFRGDHSERVPRMRDKWRRLAIESCKQCGRAHLPMFSVQPDLEMALEGWRGILLIASLTRPPVPLRQTLDGHSDVAVIVGPEGDLSEAETERAITLGAKPISLGGRVLRAELAATVACTLVAYEAGLLEPSNGPA